MNCPSAFCSAGAAHSGTEVKCKVHIAAWGDGLSDTGIIDTERPLTPTCGCRRHQSSIEEPGAAVTRPGRHVPSAVPGRYGLYDPLQD